MTTPRNKLPDKPKFEHLEPATEQPQFECRKHLINKQNPHRDQIDLCAGLLLGIQTDNITPSAIALRVKDLGADKAILRMRGVGRLGQILATDDAIAHPDDVRAENDAVDGRTGQMDLAVLQTLQMYFGALCGIELTGTDGRNDAHFLGSLGLEHDHAAAMIARIVVRIIGRRGQAGAVGGQLPLLQREPRIRQKSH